MGTVGLTITALSLQRGSQVITGLTGKVREAVEAYESSKLQPGKQPNVAAHSGSTAIQ